MAGVPVQHDQGALPAQVLAQGRPQGDPQAARLGGGWHHQGGVKRTKKVMQLGKIKKEAVANSHIEEKKTI